MRKRLALLATAAVAAVLLPATAAGERYEVPIGVGYHCTADAVVPNQTRLVAGESGSSTLRVVPLGNSSVITHWGAAVAPGLGSIAQQLVVFEPLGNGAYRKVAESNLETLSAGSGFFKTRIPVRGGEAVGLFGPDGTLACIEDAATFERTEAVSLRSEGSAAIGGTMAFETENGIGTPVSAGVEPDNDEDGYGDYGQDRCDGTASRGSDCPIEVRIGRTIVKQRAILVPVTSEAWARIKVRGAFRWQGDDREVAVDRHTPRRRMKAGRTDVFRVPLPPEVQQRLNRMRPGQSLPVSLEFSVTDRDDWDSERRRRLMLWGRG
jgi:hypothetical protein